ncbi:hypothetical protein E2C01_068894 [Portunus trituberculatus]|uniref:Uncharacterized protein n=1 Tax=Portunus trituberculatus TaxID=210409 RepID=A0A5B7I1D4_PORTR|nr:hypothetical protein [Portunus trituberculatus]
MSDLECLQRPQVLFGDLHRTYSHHLIVSRLVLGVRNKGTNFTAEYTRYSPAGNVPQGPRIKGVSARRVL